MVNRGNKMKYKVTVQFECEVECEGEEHIPHIVETHNPYINGSGSGHGVYSIQSKMHTAKIISFKTK